MMAEINWIATTEKNFSDATAWDGGVVPGLSDTAVFTNTGSGNCTLSESVQVGGMKILSNYGGTFSQAGFGMRIGDGGVGKLWFMKPATFDATVDFYGDDVAVNAFITNTGTLNIHTNATYRQGNTSTWRVVVFEGATLTQPTSVHPNLGFTPYSQMYSAGIVNNGTINSEVGYTNSSFANNGTLLATGSSERYIASPKISVGPNHSVSGNIAIRGLSSRKPTFAPGDYRGFTRIYSSVSDAGTFTFSDGEFDLPLFQPCGDVIASANVLLRCGNDIEFLSAVPSFNAAIELTGTNDQDIDLSLAGITAGLSAQKTAGNVTINGGNFTLADEFTIVNNGTPNGSLTLTGASSLAGGEYAVTVADFDSSQTTGEVTISNLTVSGDVAASARTVIDSATLVGGNDQRVGLTLIENVPELVFNKSDIGNTIVQVSDSGSIEDLKLITKGTGGDAYFAGTGTVRLSDDLTLRFFTKDETILFDKNEHELKHTVLTSTFQDHFYSATKNVYSLGTNFYGSTNPQVIQNAENI